MWPDTESLCFANRHDAGSQGEGWGLVTKASALVYLGAALSWAKLLSHSEPQFPHLELGELHLSFRLDILGCEVLST